MLLNDFFFKIDFVIFEAIDIFEFWRTFGYEAEIETFETLFYFFKKILENIKEYCNVRVLYVNCKMYKLIKIVRLFLKFFICRTL